MTWRPSGAAAAATIAAVLLLAVGLLASRPDVAVLGAPLAVVAALAGRRAGSRGGASVEVGMSAGGPLDATVTVEAPADAAFAVLRLTPYREAAALVVVAPGRVLAARLPVLHSGLQTVLEVESRFVAARSFDTLDADPAAGSVAVEPLQRDGIAAPVPFEPSPRPGVRPGRRAGDGLDFRDLAPFVPGDRLRRIDWRATARQPVDGALVVRRTDALAEATAVVLLDTRDDVGERIVEWAAPRPARMGVGSLDLGREAAASLAAASLTAGDRVGFADLCRPGRIVRPGTGRRHLERLRAAVTATDAAGDRLLQLLPLPPGSLVLLVSPFLDEDPVRLAIVRRAAGQRVVAISTLPRADLAGADAAQRTANRILRIEHAQRLDRLRAADIPVVVWSEADVASRLAAVQRPRAAR